MYLPPISRDETLVLEPQENTLCVHSLSHLSSFTPEVISNLNVVLITAFYALQFSHCVRIRKQYVI